MNSGIKLQVFGLSGYIEKRIGFFGVPGFEERCYAPCKPEVLRSDFGLEFFFASAFMASADF